MFEIAGIPEDFAKRILRGLQIICLIKFISRPQFKFLKILDTLENWDVLVYINYKIITDETSTIQFII